MDCWSTYATRSLRRSQEEREKPPKALTLTRCEINIIDVSNRILTPKNFSRSEEPYSIKSPDTFYGARSLKKEVISKVFGDNSLEDKGFFGPLSFEEFYSIQAPKIVLEEGDFSGVTTAESLESTSTSRASTSSNEGFFWGAFSFDEKKTDYAR